MMKSKSVERDTRKAAIAIGLGALVAPTLGIPIFRAIQEGYDKDGLQFVGSSLVESPEIKSSSLRRRTLATNDGTYLIDSRPSVVTSFVSSYTISSDGSYVLFSQLFPKDDQSSKDEAALKFGLKFTTWNTRTGKLVESKFPAPDEPILTSKSENDSLRLIEKHRVYDFSILGRGSSGYAIASLRASDFDERSKNSGFSHPVNLWGISLQSGAMFRLGSALESDFVIGSPAGNSGFIFSVQKRGGGSGEGPVPVTVVSHFSMQQGVSKSPSILDGLVMPRGWNKDGNLVCYHQEASGPEGWVTISPITGESDVTEGPRPQFEAPIRFDSPLKVTERNGRFYLEPKEKAAEDPLSESSLELPPDTKGGDYISQNQSGSGLLMLIKEDGSVVSYRVRRGKS